MNEGQSGPRGANSASMAVAFAVAISGCGSASLVLEAPIADQCTGAGLRGCDQLTEGVLLYVDGKKAEGEEKIRQGVVQNAPEDVQRYASLVRTLAELPGASSFSGPILEVTAFLEAKPPAVSAGAVLADAPATGASTATAEQRAAAASLAAVALPNAPGGPTYTVTADTDPSQTRHGIGKAPTERQPWCAGALGDSVRCRALAHGPLYVSHVFATGPDCEGQSIAVVRHGKPWLHVQNAEALRGTRIAIEKSDTLVLVQRQKSTVSRDSKGKRAKDTDVVELEEADPRLSCDVYWSGFAPYGTTPSTPVDVEVLLDY